MHNLKLLCLVSFVISLILGHYIIPLLRKLQKKGQPIREDGPVQHIHTKKGTPTMGGLIILLPTTLLSLLSLLICPEIDSRNILILIFVFVSYAILGGIDDYKKVVEKNSKGLSVKLKLFGQFTIAAITIYFLNNCSTAITFPGSYMLDLSWLYYPFAVMVIFSHSNAVNMTDGLDGLATVPIIVAAICLSVISYYSDQSAVLFFCLSLIGSSLGFLFFNANPAKVFMGDIGSLSIGAVIGTMSIMVKHEIIFAVITGLFVIEALSVIIQVYYFKITGGRRVFRMAPIHHHFEQLGWSENTVVVRFWIVAVIFAIIGMSFI